MSVQNPLSNSSEIPMRKSAFLNQLKNKLTVAGKGMENTELLHDELPPVPSSGIDFTNQKYKIAKKSASPSPNIERANSPEATRKYFDKLINVYENVLDVINNMDTKLVGNVMNTQDSMLTAYKQKFLDIQKEMIELRNQLSEEKCKLRRDKQIRILEEERNWYRDELTKADATLRKMEAEQKLLREDCEEAIRDRQSLQKQVFDLKKEIKTLTLGQNDIVKQASQTTMKPFFRVVPKIDDKRYLRTQSQERIKAPIIEQAISVRNQSVMDPKTHLSNQKIYEEQINSLKKQLENERKANRILKADRVNEKIRETELKAFFQNCIEDVKKDILYRTKGPAKGDATTRTMQKSKILAVKNEQEQLNTYDQNLEEKTASDVPLNAFLTSDKKKVLEMVFSKEEFIDSVVQMLFPVDGGIKMKNPIKELVEKSKERQKSLGHIDLKRLKLKRGKRKVNYIEYKPFGVN